MLKLAVVFFIFSLIAAIFGFSGLVAASAGAAQILFYTFIGLFFVAIAVSLFQGLFHSPDKHV